MFKAKQMSKLNAIDFTSQDTPATKELTSATRNIKVELRTWNTLRNLKGANETFNDVVLAILKERTVSMGGDNVKAIKYSRKTIFLETEYDDKSIGVEFEYNDVKNEQSHFSLDLKIRKIFYGKKIMNPSVFFGVDDLRKHFHRAYLSIYLNCVAFALEKEFKVRALMMFYVHFKGDQFENIARWRKIYYDYSLSEDSFIHDIEEPLASSEEMPNEKVMSSIKKSPSNSVWGIIQ